MTTTTHETDAETQEAPQNAEQPASEAEGQPTAPSLADEAPATPLSPVEALAALDDDVTSKAVAISTPAGSLTLDPNQTELNDIQRAALVAIGINFKTEPAIIPHARAFIHMCQIRGLDPFAREAYLIGRGKGDKRKYTMQTGIDGYRKMGAATGRFIRVKKVLWTGSDDDSRSYVQVTDEDGDVVMKRRWYDQWPAGRGNPGAAKVVIEHQTLDGDVTTTAAVADWGMYAPYNDEWEDKPGGGRRPKIVNGKPVQTLGDMWAKGGPHMLSKCAEALAYRKAFPASMSGIYITEELHRADADERKRAQVDAGRARREALAAAQREQRTATPLVTEDVVDADVVVETPTTIAADVADVVEATKPAAVDDATVLGWLCGEFDYQAEALGQRPTVLAKRVIASRRKNLDEFGVAEMLPMVVGFRSMVLAATAGRDNEPVDVAYRETAYDNEQPIDWDALVGNGAEPEPAADPDAEHLFVATEEGGCWTCGLPEDVGPHVEGSNDETAGVEA